MRDEGLWDPELDMRIRARWGRLRLGWLDICIELLGQGFWEVWTFEDGQDGWGPEGTEAFRRMGDG